MLSNTPQLSVCLIARNEAQRLSAAIESVRAVADEVVVCDTGSDDGTPELAARLGARVCHFEWIDDFAAARNACQTHARGEWILWLDADERLKAGCEDALRGAIADPRVLAYQVIREDFFAEGKPDWFSEMYQLRLVRRYLPCRWQGRIHEHLEPSPVDVAKARGMAVRVSGVRLQHWGYIADRLPSKQHRAAYLCELELQARPGQLYYLIERARALIAVGSDRAGEALGEAAQVMLARRDRASPSTPMIASLIEALLALPQQPWATVEELTDLAGRWFPRNAPLLWAVAREHAVRSRWPESEAALRRLIELVETGTHDRFMSFDPRVLEDARFNLGVALIRQARLDEAEAVYRAMLGSSRRARDAQANIDAIARVRAEHGA